MFRIHTLLRRQLFAVLVLAGAVLGLGGGSQALAQDTNINQDMNASKDDSQASPMVGSWLVTYNVAAFVIPIPILLSFTNDGIIIETDSPAPTPFGGTIGTLFLSNGHGSWKKNGKYQFAYTYRKILYGATGNPFGLVRTNGAVTLNKEGTIMQANLDIRFTDNNGNVVLHATGTASGGRIEVEQQ